MILTSKQKCGKGVDKLLPQWYNKEKTKGENQMPICPNCDHELELVEVFDSEFSNGDYIETGICECEHCGKRYLVNMYYRLYTTELYDEED